MAKALSLFQLNNKIKKTINTNFAGKQWIIAEISELRVNQNGHCYLELIEKDDKTNKIIAKARATIWAHTFPMLNSYFFSETNKQLSAGLKILLYGEVLFQEVYSFSINIVDVDPNYTLGDIAKKRKDTIERLENEGVFTMNKDLYLKPLTKTIALISSPTAAGYEDFINQINAESHPFKFIVKLFPAVMQGENADKSITNALDNIYLYEDVFDVVVIIRGGGSQSDLNCFDSYLLAYYVTQFPMPIVSGIGHQRDQSVVDMVANVSLKTPTAVADFLIDRLYALENELLILQNKIIYNTESILGNSREKLNSFSHRFIPIVKASLEIKKSRLKIAQSSLEKYTPLYIKNKEVNLHHQLRKLKLHLSANLSEQNHLLNNLHSEMKNAVSSLLINQNHKLNMWVQTIKYADPELMLKKGYSISKFKGKVLKSTTKLKEGDIIETFISGAILTSEIKKIHKNGEEKNIV